MSYLVKITPLGGLGQIGSNMVHFEYGSESLLIDCGILFPYEDLFDLNYLIPDLDAIDINPSKLIITHGHEDHIGAIIHVLQKFPQIEVFAPPFARELVLKKLGFNEVAHTIHEYGDSSQIDFKNFTIYPIRVNHSIPDSYGILVSDKKDFCCFYASDFKIDLTTDYEPPFDFKRLKDLTNNKKFRLLMADSTNITSKTLETPSEKDVFSELNSIIKSVEGRVFVTSFASNVHRLKSILISAKESGRKVIPYGRALKNYLGIAEKLGLLEGLEKTLVSEKSYTSKQGRYVILLSGCQGEFRGTLRRVAMGEDSIFKPGPKDTFVFSSKAIPGHEKKISILVNSLYSFGAKVITADDKLVHVSGHPGKNDLLKLYNEFSPTDIMPIHGETSFLHRHVEFINESFPQAKAHLFTNFDQAIISKKREVDIKRFESPPPILIHGKHLEIERSAISQRRKIAANGVVFISINIDSISRFKPSFSVSLLGLPDMAQDIIEDLEPMILDFIKQRKLKTLEEKGEEIRISARRILSQHLGYKPVTVVQFV